MPRTGCRSVRRRATPRRACTLPSRSLFSCSRPRRRAVRALLVLPALDFFAALVIIDALERKVDLALDRVDLRTRGDDLLTLADVIADVLDPPCRDLGEVNERLTTPELVERDERAKVPDRGDGPDDQLSFLR